MMKRDKLQILTLLFLLLGRGANGFLTPTSTTPSSSWAVPPARISKTTTNTKRHRSVVGDRSRRNHRNVKSSSTALYFLGTDGGILGVGAPEVAVTLAVGYFILGPSELYKLVKEIGKFIQNFRTLGAEATKSFEATMENQLELTELRKAQRELNEAFSFRRSINTDEYGEAFDEALLVRESAGGGAAVTAATSAAAAPTELEKEETNTKKKRRLVRRKKKSVEEPDEPLPPVAPTKDLLTEYPDLDMSDETSSTAAADEASTLRARRLQRLDNASPAPAPAEEPDRYAASERDVAARILDPDKNAAIETYESNRFRSQLSAEEWNARIVANQDELSPLAVAMQRLAILEEEKQAADRRLEEEYRRRMDNEDKYYLEKRRVLEEAIGEIQEGIYGGGAGKSEGPKFG